MANNSSLNAIEIKYLRLSLGLSTAQVADLVNVSAEAVEAWEAGEAEVSGLATKNYLNLMKQLRCKYSIPVTELKHYSKKSLSAP